jgi:hypothetical protein
MPPSRNWTLSIFSLLKWQAHRPVAGRLLPRDCLIRKISIYAEYAKKSKKPPLSLTRALLTWWPGAESTRTCGFASRFLILKLNVTHSANSIFLAISTGAIVFSL